MSEADLRAEIDALRREIAAMRAERAEHAAADQAAEPAAEFASASGAANFAEQMRTLAREVSAFAEEAEEGVAHHPLTSVLGALILGILIGRAFHR